MKHQLSRKARRMTTQLEPWEARSENQPREALTQRYLSQSTYLLPKDDQEADRLTFQHHALAQAIGKHYVAPFDPANHSILDVGTGTGIWAAEMARAFPHALVVGVDLDQTLFRETPPLPLNCLLRGGDVLKGLPFPDRFFGFTHQRLLVYAIPTVQWPAVLHELVRVTLIGGWIESVETDSYLHNQGPATRQLLAHVGMLQKARGIYPEAIRQLDDLFRRTGLQQVEVKTLPLALGAWGGRIGGLLKRDALSVFEALKEPCCQHSMLEPQIFETLLGQMEQEWETYRTSCICRIVYGRRGQG